MKIQNKLFKKGWGFHICITEHKKRSSYFKMTSINPEIWLNLNDTVLCPLYIY